MNRNEKYLLEHNQRLLKSIQKKVLVIKCQKCSDIFNIMTSQSENKEVIFVDDLVNFNKKKIQSVKNGMIEFCI